MLEAPYARPTPNPPPTSRHAVHLRLDGEYDQYELDRQRSPWGYINGTPRIRGVEREARNLVASVYGSDHALYMGGHKSEPTCQRADCDNCHRVLALLCAAALCEDKGREEMKPILDWIMDPAFLG